MEKDNAGIKGTERRLYDRMLKYAGVFGGVQGVVMLVSVVLAKVKSLLLGPAGFGITENLNRTTDIVKNATNLGIQTVAVPKISVFADNDKAGLSDRITVTRSWALLAAIAGMVICFILAPVLGRWAFNGDTGYTVDFMLLSLSVAAASVTGGEIAVLRGGKHLRNLALSQLFASILSLCISVPLFRFFRLDGIVPALVLSAVGTMAVTCFYSFRLYPYKSRPFSPAVLRKGLDMIGFGVLLTIVAFLGAWAWSIIARFLMGKGGAELTGTYSAGYMLVTYFTALLLYVTDSEYYPRLAAAGQDIESAHRMMNSQAQAMIMISAPLIICFIILMPLVVYIVLEYGKFQGSITVAQFAVVGVLFKSVSVPVAYLVLAKSDSVIYIIQETLCNILLIICVIAGYNHLGLIGLGISFAVWELLYLGIVLFLSGIRYSFRLSRDVVICFLIQTVLAVTVSFLSLSDKKALLILSLILLAASCAYSFFFFRKHTTFMSGLENRIRRLFSHR